MTNTRRPAHRNAASRLHTAAVIPYQRRLRPLAESGLKGYQAQNWNCVVAPRGTPAPIVLRLNREINAILNTPAVGNRIRELGIEMETGTPDELGRFIRDEIARFQNLVKAIGLKPE